MAKTKIPNELESAVKDGFVTNTAMIVDRTDPDNPKAQNIINQELYALITSLPVSDGTDIGAGEAYIDSTDRTVKVKATE